MSGICADRVVVVTGAATAIGAGPPRAPRSRPRGAKGRGERPRRRRRGRATGARRPGPPEAVVAEIVAAGRRGGSANTSRRSPTSPARKALIDQAIETYGRLERSLVNNRGNPCANRMLTNMSEAEWERRHQGAPEGPPSPPRATTRARVTGRGPGPRPGRGRWTARIINTSSPSGIFGKHRPRPTTARAKAGNRRAFTINRVAGVGPLRRPPSTRSRPPALTRLTEDLAGFAEDRRGPPRRSPSNSPPSTSRRSWCGSASPASAGVTGPDLLGHRKSRISVRRGAGSTGPPADKGLPVDPPPNSRDVIPGLGGQGRRQRRHGWQTRAIGRPPRRFREKPALTCPPVRGFFAETGRTRTRRPPRPESPVAGPSWVVAGGATCAC